MKGDRVNMEENKVNENQNLQQGNTASENLGATTSKKKKSIVPIIVLISALVLFVLIIAGILGFYFMVYTKPDQIYKRMISSNIDEYVNKIQNVDYNTSKENVKISANVESDEIDEEYQQIADIINDTSIEFDVQTDRENKQLVVGLDAKYDDESLINAQFYSNINDKKSYIYLKELLDKYFEIEIDDEEIYNALSKLLETKSVSNDERKSFTKSMEILKKELVNVVKTEYCTSTQENVLVDGKETKLTKNSIKMTMSQFKKEALTVLNNLKNNEEFLKCFENKEEVIEKFDAIIESFEEIEESDIAFVEIAVYTKGLLHDVVKYLVSMPNEDEEQITVEITEISKNQNDFQILQNGEKVISGNINVQEKNKNEGVITITFDVEEVAKLKINIEYIAKYNEKIDTVDIENSSTLEELTAQEQQELTQNLQESKLFSLFTTFSGGMENSLPIDNIGGEYNQDDENDDVKNQTTEAEILTYDNKNKIGYGVPTGFETEVISENYKVLSNDDIRIEMKTTRKKANEQYQTIKDKVNYYTDGNYKNVKVSDVEELTVNGKTFNQAIFSYDYESGSYKKHYSNKYVWIEVSDTYILDIRIENDSDLKDSDLQKILNINVSKV